MKKVRLAKPPKVDKAGIGVIAPTANATMFVSVEIVMVAPDEANASMNFSSHVSFIEESKNLVKRYELSVAIPSMINGITETGGV